MIPSGLTRGAMALVIVCYYSPEPKAGDGSGFRDVTYQELVDGGFIDGKTLRTTPLGDSLARAMTCLELEHHWVPVREVPS